MTDDWQGGSPENKTIFQGIDGPNREDLGLIPFGSHVLLMNLKEDGVDLATGVWREDDLVSWRFQLPDDTTRFENTSMFYVKPENIKEADAPLVNVLPPEEIAEARIRENYGDDVGLEVALEDGSLDVDGIRAMLIEAVKQARKGLVQNPF